MHEMQAQQWRFILRQLNDSNAPMTGEAQSAVRTWIEGILEEKGWAAARLAKEAGVAPSTITRALDTTYQYVPSTRTLSKIAAAVNRVAPEIASEGLEAARPLGRRIPVMGEVRAGAWIEMQTEPVPTEWLYFDDPAFEKARVWALNVVGTSMNLEYVDGSTVIVVDAAEAGIQEGDHVVVRRSRAGGYETTLKEVVVEPGGVALWPRSSDPAHQSPIYLKHQHDSDDGAEIIAVVIGAYKKRTRRPGKIVGI